MTSPLCVATGGWCRRVFHYRPPTPMYRNSPPLCTIVLQIPSLMPLKMRKVQLQAYPHTPQRSPLPVLPGTRCRLPSVPCLWGVYEKQGWPQRNRWTERRGTTTSPHLDGHLGGHKGLQTEEAGGRAGVRDYQGATRRPQVPLTRSANVAAEWTVLATAFNLRTLCRVWRARIFDRVFGQSQCPSPWPPEPHCGW